MWNLLRPLLFSLPPETAHALALRMIQFIGWSPLAKKTMKRLYSSQGKPIKLWGLNFNNQVGLAAGWDKDARAIHGLSAFGFGHVETGTVTPNAQPGKKKPRIFRLSKDEVLINRMGFPSRGENYVAEQLLYKPEDIVVGVNLGKNSDTPNEEAYIDYCTLLERFASLADYLVINLSSPNTVGLRDLQARNSLDDLLHKLQNTRQNLPSENQRKVPLLVKLSPDLSDQQLDDAVGVILDNKLDGVVATNTTLSRDNLLSKHKIETGGASGKILTLQSREILKKIVDKTGGNIPIISTGGIMSADEAKRRVDMGASLVQLYTGFVYHGPKLIRQINKNL